VSTLPIAVAMVVGFGAFAALLPWLILESRRPVAARPALRVPEALLDLRHHPRMSALAVCTRSFAVTIARAMEPTPESVVAHWRIGFDAGREHAVAAPIVDVAPMPVVTVAAAVAPAVEEPAPTRGARVIRPAVAATPSRAHVRPHHRGGRKQLVDTLKRAGEVGHPTTPRARRERTVVRTH